MNKLVMRFTMAAAALAIAASAAAADDTIVKKKKSFFSELFGGGGSFKKKRRPRNPNWSQDDVRVFYGRVEEEPVFRKKPKKKPSKPPSVIVSDPETIAGFGLGNLTYVPEKLVPLSEALKDARPSIPVQAAIYDVLSSPEPAARVVQSERDAILAHYKSTGFSPVWLSQGQLAPRAAAVLKVLGAAADEGLDPQHYLPQALASFDPAAAVFPIDPMAQARIDVGLTAMALKYARHMSGGQFDPRRLSLYNDLTPERVPANQALKVLAWSPFPEAYLVSLQPRHSAYGAMKKALAELRAKAGGKISIVIAEGNRVKPGKRDPRLVEVRARLRELGLMAETAIVPAEDEDILDPALSLALKTFQKNSGIKASGALDGATVTALNDQGGERDVRRLVHNMERLRWLPKLLGSSYVMVNQAAFQVRVIDKDQEVWRSNVIVGKPLSQTSAFHDEIEMVVFNPSWGVPPSIIANEYLPKLRRDPGYLDRLGFKVVNTSGKVVPSSTIGWSAYGAKVPFSIQQPPGPKNALGEIKFLFPNKHDIYMHDTPARELFDEEVRAFSHGCVRVQNPREFATILLGWDRGKIDETTDSGKSQTVRLKTKVPIHVTYFTAWPDEDGTINYYRDLYGRDEAIEKALSGLTVAQR